MIKPKCENFVWWAEALLGDCIHCKDPVKNCPAKKMIEDLSDKVTIDELRKFVDNIKDEKFGG